MDNTRKLALAAGVFYILTFVFSLPTLGLKEPLVDHADWILGNGSDKGILWAGFFDFLCAVTGIGSAVALYPIVRRFSPASAIGFVASRTLEGAILVVGAISLLSIVSLRGDVVGGDTSAMVTTSQSLIAQHDWSFLFGPGFMPAINAAILATVMYRYRLVPRIIPIMGLIGAPLLFASTLGSLLGGPDRVSESALLFALPIAAWEFSLGMYLIVKGVRATDEVTVEAPVASPALATV